MNVGKPLQNAVQAFQAGHLGQVEAICGKILKTHPQQPDALHLLGAVALREGRHEKAIALIEAAVEQSPDNAYFHANLGEAYRAHGRFERAVPCFERALEIDPERAEAHSGLGNILLAQGKADDALVHYDRALALNANLAPAHYNRGNALFEAGRLDEAIAAYRKAVAVNPYFGDAFFNLGNALSALGELANAASAYEEATRAAPHFAKAHHNLGNAYRKLGRFDGASKAYRRALEIDATLAGAHVHLGTIAKLQGRLTEALASFDRAIELEPDFALAHSERAHTLLLRKRTTDSIASYRRSVDLAPQFAWGWMGLSSALAEDGQTAEACAASQKALRLRRSFEWPFLGRKPIGRVVVLKGIEDSHFTVGRGDQLKFKGGVNNVDSHFDRTRFAQCSFYVDGLDTDGGLGDLPDCDVIFNAISDPDAMPRSYEIAKSIAGIARVPVLNPPDAVAKTLRNLNYEAMRGIDGILFPKTLRLETRIATKRALMELLDAAEIELPVLARATGTHAGESLEKVDTADQLWDYFSTHEAASYFITQFHDYTIESGDYLKMRFHVIDHVLYPNQLYLSDDWNVQGYPHVKERMLAHDWMIERASRFLRDPEGYLGKDAFRAVSAACDLVPLDYFGIDFTLLADGRILVFEANANMQIPYVASEAIAQRKPCIEAIGRALNEMIENRMGLLKTSGV